MKRFLLALAILAMALLPAGTAIAGKTVTITFDNLPLGPLAEGKHVIGKFTISRIAHHDNVQVVDLGDGRRGLVDSNPGGGSPGGISIVPRAPRTSMRVQSFTAQTDGGDVILMAQWTEGWEYFQSSGDAPELFVPTFAGKEVAFLNLAIYGRGESHVIVSVDAEISTAVDPGYIGWTTSGKSRMKIADVGKDRWKSTGIFETEGHGALFSGSERDGPGSTLAYSGTWARESDRAFLLTLDESGREAFAALLARRFAEKAGMQGTFSLSSVVGQLKYNAKRTRIGLKWDIQGVVTGEFGTRAFTLKTRSKGKPQEK